jgi:hypothetical protein
MKTTLLIQPSQRPPEACSHLSSGSHALGRFIPLTQGKHAIVDAEDYKRINQWKWYALKNGNNFYAVRNIGKHPHQIMIRMHREVLGLKLNDGKQADHRDGNGLDNRRFNLRLCTHSQNQHNQHSIRGISKYKGVSWIKKDKKWKTKIQFEQKSIAIGRFDSEIEAAKAYDKKAKELFGEFACTNFRKEKQMDAYNCPNCEEQDTTQVTCPSCDKHFCEECEEDNFKFCHICDKKVCTNCYTEHEVNGVRTCDTCFDKLIVIKSNYDVLTLEINAVIEKITDVQLEDAAFMLGTFCGTLKGLKNRFGF